jgi:hypothetical protein
LLDSPLKPATRRFQRAVSSNTLQIARIVETLRQADIPVVNEDLAYVSPVFHRHVIPNGTYHFLGAIERDHLS